MAEKQSCSATTTKGDPCSRPAAPECDGKCKQHHNMGNSLSNKIKKAAGGSAASSEDSESKKKDSNGAKTYKSAYQYYGSTRRDTLKAENPGVSGADINKMIAAEWKELPDTQKQPFQDHVAPNKAPKAAKAK